MDQLNILSSLSHIAADYDAVLCDAWGVIHNGVDIVPGIEAALINARRDCGPVLILTNAPRPSAIIPAQLDRLGLSDAAYDGVVTSGDAIRAEIVKRLPGAFFRLGPEKDDPLFDNLGIEFVPIEKADAIICTGLMDDTRETPEEYRDILAIACERDTDFICANPDIRVRWGDKIIYCAGAIAQLYEQMGGRVIHGGKPHKPIYDLAMKQLMTLKPDIERSRVLCIGDGLHTDILGANRNGFDVVYVYGAGGIHEGGADPDSLTQLLNREHVTARAAMERVIW